MPSSSGSVDPRVDGISDLITANTVVVFDLDDTLYKEIDFVDSGFRFVLESLELPAATLDSMHTWLKNGDSVFGQLRREHEAAARVPESDLVELYRQHFPNISLDTRAQEALGKIKRASAGVAVITDGRSTTQRNKIEALGLGDFFDLVVVSEETGYSKPETHNFELAMDDFGHEHGFIYIADNPAKDFIAPNALGWWTVMVEDDGRNIHNQAEDSSLTKAQRTVSQKCLLSVSI